MIFIPLHKLIIPEYRQRKEFDKAKLMELVQSIQTKGLMHPIVLKSDGVTLNSGERRVKAMTHIYNTHGTFMCGGKPVPAGYFPALTLSDLSPLELMEAELEENVVRQDLTWLERSAALAQLHKLRTAQAAERGETHTLRATASEVLGKQAEGGQVTALRNALLIDDFKDDPEVAGASSEKEAFNIVKRKLTQKFTAALAKNVKASTPATPHMAYRGDCRVLSGLLAPGTFDVLITDPPYGIGADTFTATDGSESGTKHEYKDTPEYAQEVMRGILGLSVTYCKESAALYMFCDFSQFHWLTGLASSHGWTPWPRPLIWHKPAGGMMGDTQHGPRRSYETIFYAYRGNKRTSNVALDVIVHQPRESSRHAAEKPVEVYVNLLRRHTVPGMSVLDPCMGSGPIFPASNILSLRATGMEIVENHFNLALTRINDKE